MVLSRVTCSLTSCARSLSPVEIKRWHAQLPGLLGQGANHIIGLDTVHHNQRQTHRLDNLMYWLNLTAQIIRHGWAISLVLAVHIVTKSFALGIKHNRNITVRVAIDQAL